MLIYPWVLCFRCCGTGATSVRRGRNRSPTARRPTRHSARAVSPGSTPLRMTGYHADRAASARRNRSGSDSARRCATPSVWTKVSAVDGESQVRLVFSGKMGRPLPVREFWTKTRKVKEHIIILEYSRNLRQLFVRMNQYHYFMDKVFIFTNTTKDVQ